MNALVGATISKILSDGNHGESLAFITDKGRFDFVTYGDCCSRTWIEHLSNLDQMIGATVTGIEEVDLPDAVPSPPSEVDVEAIYGTKILTTKGCGLLEYRNDSNGYYGGSIGRASNPQGDLPELLEDF